MVTKEQQSITDFHLIAVVLLMPWCTFVSPSNRALTLLKMSLAPHNRALSLQPVLFSFDLPLDVA